MGKFDFLADKKGYTYDDIQRRRAIVDALAGRAVSQTPTTFGEGLSSLGAALGSILGGNRVSAAEAKRAAEADKAMSAAFGAMPQDYSALSGALGSEGMTFAGQPGDYAGIRQSLSGTESGGRLDALNNEIGAGGVRGHGGRLQFGAARLADAARAGVIPQMTPFQFSKAPGDVQSRVEDWHFGEIDNQAHKRGLDRYFGQTVGGVPITPDAVRAMAHLGGIGGAEQFLESGGQANPSDSFGTSLRDYALKHGGASGGVAPMAFAQPAPVNVSLIRAMSNPYLSPEQRQILGGVLQQQQSMQMTPYQQAQMAMEQQKFDFGRQQAAQPAPVQYGWQTMPDGTLVRTDSAGGMTPMGTFQKPEDDGRGVEYGLSPQYGTDENGNPIIIQIGKDGSAIKTAMPDGVKFQKEPIKIDAGTHWILLDPISRQPVGQIEKKLEDAAFASAKGAEVGKAQAAAEDGLPAAISKAETAIGLINAISNDPALAGITGMIQGRLPPMTQAGTDLNVKIQQVQGQVFLEAFETLKGGGQITEIEGQKAEAAMARLSRAQSDSAYRDALAELSGILKAGVDRARSKAGQLPERASSDDDLMKKYGG